jgi:hypothetical protein
VYFLNTLRKLKLKIVVVVIIKKLEIMEVKVISHESEQKRVNIFEGEDIYYSNHKFSCKQDFIDQYNKLTDNLTGRVLGVPEDIWKNESAERTGFFTYLNYEKDGNFMFAVIMNSKVFITNKGQTVDMFII